MIHFGISVHPGRPLARPGADGGGCCGDLKPDQYIPGPASTLYVYMLALGLLAVGLGWIVASLHVFLQDTA